MDREQKLEWVKTLKPGDRVLFKYPRQPGFSEEGIEYAIKTVLHDPTRCQSGCLISLCGCKDAFDSSWIHPLPSGKDESRSKPRLKNSDNDLYAFNRREASTIVAALRYWMRREVPMTYDELAAINDIATDLGTMTPLSDIELEHICKELLAWKD